MLWSSPPLGDLSPWRILKFTFSWLKESILLIAVSRAITISRNLGSCSQSGLDNRSDEIFTEDFDMAIIRTEPRRTKKVCWWLRAALFAQILLPTGTSAQGMCECRASLSNAFYDGACFMSVHFSPILVHSLVCLPTELWLSVFGMGWVTGEDSALFCMFYMQLEPWGHFGINGKA